MHNRTIAECENALDRIMDGTNSPQDGCYLDNIYVTDIPDTPADEDRESAVDALCKFLSTPSES